LHFADGIAETGKVTAGEQMHYGLVAKGHKMVFLSSAELGPYVDHLNHATMVLNPELGIATKQIPKGLKRMKKKLKQLGAEEILGEKIV